MAINVRKGAALPRDGRIAFQFVLLIYPLGEPLYHHPECPPYAKHNRAFILGCGGWRLQFPPHGDVPLISPLFSSAVTLGTEAAAGSSSSICCSGPDVQQGDGQDQHLCLCDA